MRVGHGGVQISFPEWNGFRECAWRRWAPIKKLNYFWPRKHWMKPVSKTKISHVAPRKTSVQLCQVRLMMMVLINVRNGSVSKFAVRQKCA